MANKVSKLLGKLNEQTVKMNNPVLWDISWFDLIKYELKFNFNEEICTFNANLHHTEPNHSLCYSLHDRSWYKTLYCLVDFLFYYRFLPPQPTRIVTTTYSLVLKIKLFLIRPNIPETCNICKQTTGLISQILGLWWTIYLLYVLNLIKQHYL